MQTDRFIDGATRHVARTCNLTALSLAKQQNAEAVNCGAWLPLLTSCGFVSTCMPLCVFCVLFSKAPHICTADPVFQRLRPSELNNVYLNAYAGSPEQIIGYMPNNMRPYSQSPYGMMPNQYHNGMMYGEQMNQPGPNARPPMYSHGYQTHQPPMHSPMQVPMNRAVSSSLSRSGSAGIGPMSHPGGQR